MRIVPRSGANRMSSLHGKESGRPGLRVTARVRGPDGGACRLCDPGGAMVLLRHVGPTAAHPLRLTLPSGTGECRDGRQRYQQSRQPADYVAHLETRAALGRLRPRQDRNRRRRRWKPLGDVYGGNQPIDPDLRLASIPRYQREDDGTFLVRTEPRRGCRVDLTVHPQREIQIRVPRRQIGGGHLDGERLIRLSLPGDGQAVDSEPGGGSSE